MVDESSGAEPGTQMPGDDPETQATERGTLLEGIRSRIRKRSILVGGIIVAGVVALGLVAFVILDHVTRVSVPVVEQQTLADATAALDGVELRSVFHTDSAFCEDDDRGPEFCVVTSQTPAGDERVHADEVVTLEVVPSEVSIPDLDGMTYGDAVDAGAEVALQVLPSDTSDSLIDGYEDWTVLTQAERGTSTAGSNLRVTLDRPVADAPAVIGTNLQGALDTLTAAGFLAVVSSDPGDPYDPAWVVTATDPEIIEGKLPVASKVSLSWGVQLPSVVGMTDLAANNALSNAKLTVTGSKSSSQAVAAQDPAAGTVLKPGDTVTITLEPPSTVYEVVSNGSRGTVTWAPPNSFSISQAGDTPLPWRMSWPTDSGYRNFNAQIMDGNSVTCNIYVNGQLVKTATSTGRYAVVSCG
ncbi:PASTA domain-containing protein [Microbacterium sp. NPDC089695]|uniref:PASTA domain-containing protein n=1 Tax=Microbacterium sp. NPDC089695 TaxID=3364198 RepID=UPI00382F6EDD